MRKLSVSHVRIVYMVYEAEHEVRIYMIGARRDSWKEDQQTILDRANELQRQIAGHAEHVANRPARHAGRRHRAGSRT
jgi:hypothetical protein